MSQTVPPGPDGHDPYHEAPSKGFTAWARLVVRHPWLALLASVALMALSGWLAATNTRVDTSVEAFADHHSEARRLLDEYRAEFGRDDVLMVLVEGDVFSVDYLTRLKALHQALAALDLEPEPPSALAARAAAAKAHTTAPSAPPADDGFGDGGDGFGDGGDGFGDGGDGFGEGAGPAASTPARSIWAGAGVFEEVTSLINIRRTRATGGGIEVGQLFDPLPDGATLAALKPTLLKDPFLVGQVLGKAGRHSAIVMRTPAQSSAGSRRILEAVEALVRQHEAPGFKPLASGLPALDKGLNDLMMNDLTVMMGLSIAAMIFILSFLFRHPMGVFAPLSVVGLAAGNTVAFMAAFDMPVTILTNVLPAFLFCVGIGDSVHLISVYRDARRLGVGNRQAIVHAVGTTGMPMFYTSLTTMVGLLSFRFATLEAIQEMGVAGAFGVFMAFVHTLVLLPALLTFNRKSLLGAKAHGGEDFIDRFLHVCRDLSGVRGDTGRGPLPPEAKRRVRTTLAVGAALLVVALAGTSQLRVWHNPLAWMPEGNGARAGLDAVDQHIGGTANVQLLIDGTPEKGMKDLALLKGLAQLEAHIRQYADAEVGPIVGNSFSLLNVIKETWQALHGGAPDQWRLPDTERGVSDALFLFSNAGPDELKRLATLDLRRSQMTIRIRWLEATSYAGLVTHIQEGIDRYIPEGRTVQATGSVYTLVNTIRNLLADLIRSFGTAFIVITFIMMFLLRSLKLGLIAMVPNLMPIVFIMGLMGMGHIPIDLSSLLIASISIGIAVDDTIHFLHHWRLQYARTGNVERAIEMSLQHSGRAMVSTSIILMVGFFTYLGATMHNLQRFGLLVGLTALMALLIDLIFAPALLRVFYKRPKEA
ncbi:MAG: MMPL family transporter [Myxococcales bacterium]|nr:MMPL family transporter [Myxococcales bacterium]